MAEPDNAVVFCALMLLLFGCLGEPANSPQQNASSAVPGQQQPSSQSQLPPPEQQPPQQLPAQESAQETPRPGPVPCPMAEPGMGCKGNIRYANDSAFQVLDLYFPENGSGPYPLIIHVHGGGWSIGEKGGGPVGLLKDGYALAEVEYRLSDEAKFPAQIEDVKDAIGWLRANAGEYKLDPDRFGMIGESAGGHLVALAGTSGNSAEFGGEAKVQAVADYFGPVDFNSVAGIPVGERYGDYTSAASMLIGGAIDENPAIVAQASPLTYIDSGDPPFLIIHGTDDDMVPYNESVKLYSALKNAGVNVTLVTVDGGGHGGFENKNELYVDVREFFDRTLKGG